MPIHDILHVLRLETRNLRQHAYGPIEICCLFADDGDGERAAVFDEHRAVAVEHHATRCPQRDRALMIVLRELPEFLVLDNLKVPKAEGENREHHGTPHLQHDQTNRETASIFNWRREFCHVFPLCSWLFALGSSLFALRSWLFALRS